MARKPHSEETKARISAAMSGKPRAPHSVESRARRAVASMGKSNANWRGDEVTYFTAHRRARQEHAGKPCEHSDESCKGILQVAFRHETPAERIQLSSEGAFSTDPSDYRVLCRSHHRRYDFSEVGVLANG